jgi:hypothetical protein
VAQPAATAAEVAAAAAAAAEEEEEEEKEAVGRGIRTSVPQILTEFLRDTSTPTLRSHAATRTRGRVQRVTQPGHYLRVSGRRVGDSEYCIRKA